MAAAPAYNDGSLEYGSASLTITPKGGGTTWTALTDPDFSYDSDTKRVEQTNQYGEPTKAFGIPQTKTGSCTIQLPTGQSAVVGDTFVADVTTTKVWIVTRVGHVFAKEDYRKQSISFAEKLSA